MGKDLVDGDWGQPKYSASAAPELGVDETQLSDYYASKVARRFTTVALLLASTPPANNYSAKADNAPGAWFERISGSWVMFGVARFADSATRASVITAPALGMRTYQVDKGRVEEYFTTAFVAVAGWFPVAGVLPAFQVFGGTSQDLGLIWTLVNGAYGTPELSRGFTSFTSGVLTVAQAGLYELAAVLEMPVGTGIIGVQIVLNSTATDTTATIVESQQQTASSILKTVTVAAVKKLAAADVLRLYAVDTSGADIANVARRLSFTVRYLGPA